MYTVDIILTLFHLSSKYFRKVLVAVILLTLQKERILLSMITMDIVVKHMSIDTLFLQMDILMFILKIVGGNQDGPLLLSMVYHL